MRSEARRAGLLYWMAGFLAPFAYLYVPSRLGSPDGALAIAERVRASEGLLRAAIGAELFGVTALLFAALALYDLFKHAGERAARVMAAMMLVSVAISYVNALNHVAPLVLLKSPAITAASDPGQIGAQVTLFLRLHDLGLVVNQFFWGLWLFPIGILILRSGRFPRWLAWPLFVAGAGYVLNSSGELFLPPSQRWITRNLLVLGVGEAPFFLFYLLIWGIRGYAVDRVAAALALLLVAMQSGALALLMTDRIGPALYGVLAMATLGIALGMVIRWRLEP